MSGPFDFSDPPPTTRRRRRRSEDYDDGPRAPERPPFNHGLHLILDALTCGAWVPVHAGLWVLHVMGVM